MSVDSSPWYQIMWNDSRDSLVEKLLKTDWAVHWLIRNVLLWIDFPSFAWIQFPNLIDYFIDDLEPLSVLEICLVFVDWQVMACMKWIEKSFCTVCMVHMKTIQVHLVFSFDLVPVML